MGELKGQVAIVTGGGRGIGRVIAVALAAAGARVCVSARSSEQLTDTVNAIIRAGGQAMAYAADVIDRQAVERLVQATEDALGPIDLLVNNAGSYLSVGPIWAVDPDDWWRDVETNVRGPMLCARAVLPGMLSRGCGRIINVASATILRGHPMISGYNLSKTALVRFTESLATSTAGAGISVFAINPGNVDTEMTRRVWQSPEGRQWMPGVRAAFIDNGVSPEPAGHLCVQLASGIADALSGRYFDVTDDLQDMVSRREEILREDQYVLRLRK